MGRLPRWPLLLGLGALVVATLCAAAAWGQSGFAADGPTRVAVHVEGRSASEVRDAVAALMPAGVESIEPADFTLALRRVGLRGPVGPAIHARGRRAALVRVLHRAMGKVGAEALVLGRVWVRRGRRALTVLLIDRDGQVQVEDTLPLVGTAGALEGGLDRLLGEPLRALAPPPPEPPPPPAEPERAPGTDDEQPPPARESPFVPHRLGHELFVVGGGIELGGRSFSYRDGLTENLAPYEVFGVPAFTFGGQLYPFAASDLAVLPDLGLSVRYSHAFGLASEVPERSLRFSTTFNRFTGALRYRLRFGQAPRPVLLGVHGSMGFLNFTFAPESAAGQAVSDALATVEYLLLGAGLDARIPLGRWLALMPSAGYRGPLAGGEVYRRFRDASLAAFDAELLIAVVLGRGVEMRTGARYLRVASSFDPEPGDSHVAGGALDQILTIELSAAYRF